VHGLEATCAAYNFGPALTSNRSVKDLVDAILEHWPGQWSDESGPNALHEASHLNLAWDKAFHLLGWQPNWDFTETIKRTIGWYLRQITDRAAALDLVRADIADYLALWRDAP